MLPNKESEKIEFKNIISKENKEKSGMAVVALANTSGGKVYFGINDDGSISGQKYGDEDLKILANFYNSKIDPKIYTNMNIIYHPDGDVIEIVVNEAKRKIHTFDEILYIRVGTSNRKCDKNELQNRLIDTSGYISTRSGSICNGATIEDIDQNALDYFINVIIKNNLPSKFEKLKNINGYDLLYEFGMIDKKDNKFIITNDCMILFGKERSVDKLLGEYAIKYRYTESKDFTNAFDSGVAPDRDIRYPPFIDKFEKIEQKIEFHNHYLAENTLFRSKEIKQYDSITIRELIMNSIMHSDRSQQKFIEIEQTVNSLKFENYGEYKFESLIDLSENPNQYKNYKNKTLSKFLFNLGLVEREASGIIAKIVRKQQAKGLPLPVYSKTQGRTRVYIAASITNVDFAKMIMQSSDISIPELIALDSISQGHNKISKDLDKEICLILKSKGYIDISGTKHQIAILSRSFSTKIKRKGLYTKGKGLPKEKAFMLIDEHIKNFGSIKKSDMRDLFPDLTDDQISNLLSRSGKYELHRIGQASERYYTKINNIDKKE